MSAIPQAGVRGGRAGKPVIERTPISDISPHRKVTVEVYGSVIPESRVYRSPFTKRACVYYKYVIEEERGVGGCRFWRTLVAEEKSTRFILDDGTGKAMVHPHGAQMNLPEDVDYKSGMVEGRVPEGIIRLLSEAGIRHARLEKPKNNLRFREYSVGVGDNVFVTGTASRNPYENLDGTRNTDLILINKGSREGILHISDRSRQQ